MEFRKIYDEERPSPGLECNDESLCLAYQVTETCIESLVNLASQHPQYMDTFFGGDGRIPEYGDCPSPFDFQDALEVVARGEEAFYSLPARVRARFTNPVEFLSWLEDPSNYDEAEKLGLLDPEKVKARKEKESAVSKPVSTESSEVS